MSEVCLILEETYPYIIGGVSQWTHDLITSLPELDFSVLHIHSGKKPKNPRYPKPKNLKELIKTPLENIMTSTDREPLFSLMSGTKIFHSLSTGFAGYLGNEIKQNTGKPFILTEHGIYWHEVELGVDEIECGFKIFKSEKDKIKLGENWEEWKNTFRRFAQDTYKFADEIITVSQFNQNLQLSLGADINKCTVVPNGVSLELYDKIFSLKNNNKSMHIGIVARVTSIKDIKTFIRAASICFIKIPTAKFYIIGPINQDKDYYKECVQLIEKLNINNITFTGEVITDKYYKQLDLVVLTSISEGLPLVLIEAMASGIPVIATDVGGCRDLVYGTKDSLDKAGYICPPQCPQSIAEAMVNICLDDKKKRKYSEAGRNRTQKYYQLEFVIDSYRQIYSKYL